MRTKRIKEGLIRLTEEQYKSAVSLFNPKRAKHLDDHYCLKGGLKFCDHKCHECPIGYFIQERQHCLTLFGRIVDGWSCFYDLTRDYVTWYEDDDKAARRKLEKLQTWLASFKREA